MDCLEAILSTGVVNFFPKIVENFFSISASTAGLVTGIAIVPSAVIGTVTGGYVINKFQLGVPGMCAMAFVADLFCLFCGSSFLLYCPTRNVVGVTVPYGYLPNGEQSCSETPNILTLNHSCNSKSKCHPSCWSPVCDQRRKLTYFSPCYAGCSSSRMKMGDSKKLRYLECSCVIDPYDDCTNIGDRNSDVVSGFCQLSCLLIFPFMFVFALYVVLAFLTSIPIQETELRSVAFQLRSLAFGIRWIFIRLLGTIPGPILFALFIDFSCLNWGVNRKGEKEACLLYNNKKLSSFIVIAGSIIKCQILLFLFFAWKNGRKESVYPVQSFASNPTVRLVAIRSTVKDQTVQASSTSSSSNSDK